MFVLVDSYGNNSNRLFQNLHYEAFCIEYGIKFVNLTILDYRSTFPGMDQRHHYFLRLVIKTLRKVKVLKSRSFNDSLELARYTKIPLLFVGGWSYRDIRLTVKHRELLSKRYLIDIPNLIDNPTFRTINNWKTEGISLIGVHVRRGDYSEWNGGKYLFDDAIFIRYMKLAEDLLSEKGKKVGFVIFSNEETNFITADNTTISRNHWSVDHYLMSICDYLVGPPSTFTLWASYIGRTKYYHIVDPTSDLKLDDFSICNG